VDRRGQEGKGIEEERVGANDTSAAVWGTTVGGGGKRM
jgi:hypothetical protein